MRFIGILLLCLLPGLNNATTLPKNLIWQSNNSAPLWASEKAEKGGTFTDFILAFPPTLRVVGPDSNSSFRGFINANQLSLTTFHPNTMEVLPELATEWAYGKDNKTVYYRLDKDAHWSDGKPVTADDYVFTMTFMRSKFINAPWYNNYYTEQIVDIKKYDDYTISVTGAVARPKEELHYYYGVQPTPKHFHVLDDNWVKNYNWKIEPNTGPYQITDIKNGKEVIFERKEDWWAKDKRYFKNRFNVDRVVIKVIRDINIAYKYFEKGEIDTFNMLQPDLWHDKAKGRLYDSGYIEKFVFYNDAPRSSAGFFLNMDNPILADQKVRTALAYALNFEKVTQTVLRNDYQRLEAFHSGYGEYSNNTLSAKPFDLNLANNILDEDGWQERNGDGIRTKDGQALELTITYGNKEHTDRLVVLKQDAKKAGINLLLQLLDPSAQYKTIMQKQHQIAMLGWSTGFRPDYWQHFHSENAHKPQTNNVTNTDDKEMDALISAYDKETHKDKRIALAHALEAKIMEQGAFIPSWKTTYTRGAHWRWIHMPDIPGTKISDSLYSVFGDGLLWIDKKDKVDTMAARKNQGTKKPVTRIFEQYKVK
jgi:microcin C transport system substrate-binding protein